MDSYCDDMAAIATMTAAEWEELRRRMATPHKGPMTDARRRDCETWRNRPWYVE